jgi:hypothetical protein
MLKREPTTRGEARLEPQVSPLAPTTQATLRKLERAARIRKEIDKLNAELVRILDGADK